MLSIWKRHDFLGSAALTSYVNSYQHLIAASGKSGKTKKGRPSEKRSKTLQAASNSSTGAREAGLAPVSVVPVSSSWAGAARPLSLPSAVHSRAIPSGSGITSRSTVPTAPESNRPPGPSRSMPSGPPNAPAGASRGQLSHRISAMISSADATSSKKSSANQATLEPEVASFYRDIGTTRQQSDVVSSSTSVATAPTGRTTAQPSQAASKSGQNDIGQLIKHPNFDKMASTAQAIFPAAALSSTISRMSPHAHPTTSSASSSHGKKAHAPTAPARESENEAPRDSRRSSSSRRKDDKTSRDRHNGTVAKLRFGTVPTQVQYPSKPKHTTRKRI